MVIALDTETELIAPGQLAPRLVCVSTACIMDTEILDRWNAALALPSYLKKSHIVGHNVAYDMAVLGAEFPVLLPHIFEAYDDNRITDTRLRQKLIDIAQGRGRGFVNQDGKTVRLKYSLADLVERHLGLELPKTDTWRLRYGELRDVALKDWPEAATRYALTDAAVTLKVYEAQEAHRELLEDQYRQARAAFWLHLAACWGLTTDPTAVAALEDTKRRSYETLADVLQQHGLKRPDRILKSGPRKGAVIEGARDVRAARDRAIIAYNWQAPKTDKGAVALDDDACRKSGDPVLVAWADFGTTSKTLKTDVPLVRAGGRHFIQARFETLLETGRTSSSPNLQNLPTTPGLRECFVPRPGYVYAAADFSQLELHCWAQCCLSLLGGSRMAEVLNSGGDVHSMIGGEILHAPWRDVLARAKAKEPAAYHARQCGKVVNFGCPGGMGAARLVEAAKAYGVELSEDEAVRLKRVWLTTWPEAQRYLDHISRLTDGGNAVVEQLFSKRYRAGVSYCETANTYFQGLGADCAKAAGWVVSRACYARPESALFGSRVVNFVHDELILEVPEDTAHECLAELERLMVEGAAPWLPDVLPKVEGVLMRRWSKNAQRIELEGRVVPWH